MRAQAGGDGGVVAIRNGVGFVGFDNCTVANILVRALRCKATHPAVHACESSVMRDNSVVSLCFGGTLWMQPAAFRCTVTVSAYPSAALDVPMVGNRCEWLPTRACTACGMQAKGIGGLVGISDGGTGHVSVVGSTLANIMVRAHC